MSANWCVILSVCRFVTVGARESLVTVTEFELADMFQAASVNFTVNALDHSASDTHVIVRAHDQSTVQFHTATEDLNTVTAMFASHVQTIVVVDEEVRLGVEDMTAASGASLSTTTDTGCVELSDTFQAASVNLACMLFNQATTGTPLTENAHCGSTLQLAIMLQVQSNISTVALASQVQVIVTVVHEVVRLSEVIVGAAGAVVSNVIEADTTLEFHARSLKRTSRFFNQSQMANVTVIQVDETISQVNVQTTHAHDALKLHVSEIVRFTCSV